MRICLILGIFLLLLACKEPIIKPPEESPPVIIEVDTEPPKIIWISPRFDAVVNKIVIVECQVKDTSGVANVELFVDSLQSGINSISTSDTSFTFNWQTTNYDDSSEPILYIKATDNEGNDTTSVSIRVVIDNMHSFPNPVELYRIDSVFTDLAFSGYILKWRSFDDKYFAKYILHRSADPLMTNSSEIFTTEDKAVTNYEDEIISSVGLLYYQIKVEDIFGKQTPGNVISTSMFDMPPLWNILAVQYTANSLSINWNNPSFNNYDFHKLLYSDTRLGNYETLESYTDSLESQYQSIAYDDPFAENWFSVLTGDSIGQISMSTPYMHPHPQNPVIDSVLYNDHTITLHWLTEPDGDLFSYTILSSDNENPYHMSEQHTISHREDTTLQITGITESEYYLYQIISTDAWGLESRGPVVIASSFYKFSTTVGSETSNYLYSVSATEDGKYYAVGKSFDRGYWMKIGELGEIEEEPMIEGESNSAFNCIAAYDGGYLLTGYTMSEQRENLLVIKKDDLGNTEWTENYGYEFNDGGNAIVSLSDGSIGVTGYSHTNTVNQDIYILKIDVDNGNEIWSTTIGGNETDIGHDVLAADNGGMYILGETHSQGDSDGDIWILELDSDGSIVDTLLIEINGKQIGYSFARSEIGGFTIAGVTSGSSGVTDAYMIHVNEAMEVAWTFSYGGTYIDLGNSIIYSDGGWVLAGQTYSYDVGDGDAWLLKVSEMGEFEWMQTYGGINNDIAFDIDLASDGGFIICGSTLVSGNQNDGWLIKTDSRGNYKGVLSYP